MSYLATLLAHLGDTVPHEAPLQAADPMQRSFSESSLSHSDAVKSFMWEF